MDALTPPRGGLADRMRAAVLGVCLGHDRDRLRAYVRWMRRLAARLADQLDGRTLGPQPLFWPGLLPRNLAFVLVVLLHGFRRLLPPY